MKFNHKAINKAEQSFRDLLKLDNVAPAKKAFVHNFKNLCHHSGIGNLFDHYMVKQDAKVNFIYCGLGVVTEYDDGPFTMHVVEPMDAVAIELSATRRGIRRAYLMVSADVDQESFKAELHVHYHSIGKVIYPVKNDNLHNTILLAIG